MSPIAPTGLQRIVLASGNPGKLREFRQLLGGLGIELIAQSEFGISDVAETGLTFVENALLKARHAARQSGLPALADDSGLCVDALHGAPGLYSARYAGPEADSADNIAMLLAELEDVPEHRRAAHFVCVLALLRHAGDPAPYIAQGRWHGRVLMAPRGARGFGYDPVFMPAGERHSAAELSPEAKHRLSHRGHAFRTLRAALSMQMQRAI